MAGKRVQTHVLEWVIGVLMILFGIAAVWIFFSALGQQLVSSEIAMIEILLIIVLAILAQTVILIRIYEMNMK